MPRDTRTVLLLEDDFLLADALVTLLTSTFGALTVIHLSTESDFMNALTTHFDGSPPDVAIIDLMLPWTMPRRYLHAPPDIYDGPTAAGLRCYHALNRVLGPGTIATILYTVLDRNDLPDVLLPENVIVISKGPDQQPLLDALRTLMSDLRGGHG